MPISNVIVVLLKSEDSLIYECIEVYIYINVVIVGMYKCITVSILFVTYCDCCLCYLVGLCSYFVEREIVWNLNRWKLANMAAG